MRTLLPEQAAYIAGILDGEGCVSLRRETRKENRRGWRLAPIVAIYNTHLECLEWIQATMGAGALWRMQASGKHHRPHHKPIYQLNFSPNVARELLPQLLPYLRIKRDQAGLLLEYMAFNSQGTKMTPEQEIRAWEILCAIQNRRVRVTQETDKAGMVTAGDRGGRGTGSPARPAGG